MDCKQRIRDIIEIRLHNLGLRQKDLADSIGVPVSTLNSWRVWAVTFLRSTSSGSRTVCNARRCTC